MATHSKTAESGPHTAGALASFARTRRFHAVMLAGALLVPILGANMSVEAAGGVSLPGLRGRPLPTICLARRLGLECATCGATRSIITLMHGQWRRSLEFHRFGWLMALLIAMQIPYRAYRLWSPEGRLPALEACGLALLVLTAILVLGNWIVELAL